MGPTSIRIQSYGQGEICKNKRLSNFCWENMTKLWQTLIFAAFIFRKDIKGNINAAKIAKGTYQSYVCIRHNL